MKIYTYEISEKYIVYVIQKLVIIKMGNNSLNMWTDPNTEL